MRLYRLLSCMVLAASVFFSVTIPVAHAETAYERVLRTGEIRCGWGTSKPWIWKDDVKGTMQGPVVGIMESVASKLNLKLIWGEETGWGEIPTALKSGRFDVACSTLWNDPNRAKFVAFTQPLFYNAIHAYVRDDDKRFDQGPHQVNDPSVTIAIQDGDFTHSLQRTIFPKAQTLAIAQNSGFAQSLMDVATGKADVVLYESTAILDFNANNEKKLRRVPWTDPVAVFGNALAVGAGEQELRNLLDTTVQYMLQTGELRTLVQSLEKDYPGAVMPPAKPYGSFARE